MRTLVIVLIVVLLLGGGVFYLGWIQIQLPPETYGVIFTKLKGYDPEVARPGEFSWRWERLIPTNLTLYKYRLAPYSTETTARGTLPSAEVYSAVAPEAPDFAYQLRLRLSFRLKPEALLPLVMEEKLTPETLADWYEARAAEIRRRAAEALLASGGGPLFGERLLEGLRDGLQSDFPALEVLEISLLDSSVPDLEMYRRVRETYAGLLRAREDAFREAITRQAVQQEEHLAARTREDQRLELLGRYGELLDRHPVLLKLFYIQGLNGRPGSAAGTGAGAPVGLEPPELVLPPILRDGE